MPSALNGNAALFASESKLTADQARENARLAMLEDLGNGRVKDLPMEDGRRKDDGFFPSLPSITPAQRSDTDSRWKKAIADGTFDDRDAEEIKDLDVICNGRLHAAQDRKQTSAALQNNNGKRSHLTAFQPKSSPFNPRHHNLNEPLAAFGIAKKHRAHAELQGPIRSMAAAASRSNQPFAVKNQQANSHLKKAVNVSGQVTISTAPKHRPQQTTHYQLATTNSAAALIVTSTLDESVLNLQGGNVIYRGSALLQQPGASKLAAASIVWCLRFGTLEPLFIVIVGAEIYSEHPLSHWNNDWGTAPQCTIRFKHPSGSMVTVSLLFNKESDMVEFLKVQRRLMEESKKPTVTATKPSTASEMTPPVAQETQAPAPFMVSIRPPPGLPIPESATQSGTVIRPPPGLSIPATASQAAAVMKPPPGLSIPEAANQPDIALRHPSGLPGSAASQPSAMMTPPPGISIPTNHASFAMRPPPGLPIPAAALQSGVPLRHPPGISVSGTSAHVALHSPQGSLITTCDEPMPTDATERLRKDSVYMLDMEALWSSTPAAPVNNGTARLSTLDNHSNIADAAPEKKSAVTVETTKNQAMATVAATVSTAHGSATRNDGANRQPASDQEILDICRMITVHISQLAHLEFADSPGRNEKVRERLLTGINRQLDDICQPKKKHMVLSLLRMFDATLRPKGLRYSKEELAQLRSSKSKVPTGWLFEKGVRTKNQYAYSDTTDSDEDKFTTPRQLAPPNPRLGNTSVKEAVTQLSKPGAASTAVRASPVAADSVSMPPAPVNNQQWGELTSTALVIYQEDSEQGFPSAPPSVASQTAPKQQAKGLKNSRWAFPAPSSFMKDLAVLQSGIGSQDGTELHESKSRLPSHGSLASYRADSLASLDSTFRKLSLKVSAYEEGLSTGSFMSNGSNGRGVRRRNSHKGSVHSDTGTAKLI